MLKTIMQGWHFARILRVVLGVIIIVQGIVVHETSFALMGVLLSSMAVLNIGCCGPAGCGVPTSYKATKKEEAIDFEEVK
jgi:hypothetical protein